MRKYTIYILIALTSILTITGCDEDSSPVQVQSTTLDEKIGQMLMIGFRGLDVTEESTIVQDIQTGKVGGVILFDKDVLLNTYERNIQSPAQLQALIAKLKSHAKTPLFVAIDQEGGIVARLKERYGFPKPAVSQEYLGTLNNPDTTAYYASGTANTLAQMGININFAPVVDVNVNPQSPAIGKIERSFSADTTIVTNNAAIVIEEHHKKNILTSIKHFPGHGSALSDSHLGFTDVTDTWQHYELAPYRDLIQQGIVDIIMTAHIFNADLDPEYPATLSYNIITNILRNGMNYDGLIVTDAMDMQAITDNYGLETAIEKSINAGADIFLFANNLVYDEQIATKFMTIMKQLVEEGKISETRIEQSYNRIINTKTNIQ